MEFSTQDFSSEERRTEERFLQKMEGAISKFHHHYDGTPVILHPEQKELWFGEKESLVGEIKKTERQRGEALKTDYGTYGSEVSFGCGCGKKWEAFFKSDVIEVNEVPQNLQKNQGYGSSASSSNQGYGSSGSGKSAYNSGSSYR
ncbi:hypothetical protein HYU21_02110 [Candidatus Woesearchaeota archaeon]|nr:hypothetical protein [Candidatus Woesearchaeota archaeon]